MTATPAVSIQRPVRLCLRARKAFGTFLVPPGASLTGSEGYPPVSQMPGAGVFRMRVEPWLVGARSHIPVTTDCASRQTATGGFCTGHLAGRRDGRRKNPVLWQSTPNAPVHRAQRCGRMRLSNSVVSQLTRATGAGGSPPRVGREKSRPSLPSAAARFSRAVSRSC